MSRENTRKSKQSGTFATAKRDGDTGDTPRNALLLARCPARISQRILPPGNDGLEMRFFIDITDLRRQTRDKYGRIVRKLAEEAGAEDGLAVEILDGAQIVLARPYSDEATPSDWRNKSWKPSMKVAVFQRAIKLIMQYAAGRLLGKAQTEENKDALTWEFVYCVEIIPSLLRARFADFLELESNVSRREKFHFWLREREDSGTLIPTSEKSHALPLALGPGDTLVLAGASWNHVNVDALEQLKRASGCKLVFLVCDLLPIDYPSIVTTKQRAVFKEFLTRIGDVADAVVTPNKTSAIRLEGFFAEGDRRPRCRVAPIAIRGAALTKTPGGPLPGGVEASRLPRPFMLCVSSLRERKHVLWLFALCAKLFLKRPDLPRLVLAGRPDDLGVLRILSNDPAWSEIAVFIENPSDAELRRLYDNARLCLYPSFEGGVGMSIMEAENFNRLCIAAQEPSLMEAGGARTLYLPRDEALWADAICLLLDDDNPHGAGVTAPSPNLLAQIRLGVEPMLPVNR
jgi:glycosyltransferase involved in cell wall biosynthesis